MGIKTKKETRNIKLSPFSKKKNIMFDIKDKHGKMLWSGKNTVRDCDSEKRYSWFAWWCLFMNWYSPLYTIHLPYQNLPWLDSVYSLQFLYTFVRFNTCKRFMDQRWIYIFHLLFTVNIMSPNNKEHTSSCLQITMWTQTLNTWDTQILLTLLINLNTSQKLLEIAKNVIVIRSLTRYSQPFDMFQLVQLVHEINIFNKLTNIIILINLRSFPIQH